MNHQPEPHIFPAAKKYLVRSTVPSSHRPKIPPSWLPPYPQLPTQAPKTPPCSQSSPPIRPRTSRDTIGRAHQLHHSRYPRPIQGTQNTQRRATSLDNIPALHRILPATADDEVTSTEPDLRTNFEYTDPPLYAPPHRGASIATP